MQDRERRNGGSASLAALTATSTNAKHRLLAVLLAGLTALLLLLVWGSSASSKSGSTVHTAQVQRSDGAQLLHVQVAFRHGARTPLSMLYWPDEPYSDCAMEWPGAKIQLVDESGGGEDMSLTDLGQAKLPGGCRMGQLTETGFGMAKDLGAWLRKRYVDEYGLLSPTWQAEQAWARTTRYHRTLQTLQGVLTGLYPDLAAAGAPTVQVRASVEHDEYTYGSNATCPRLAPLLQAAQRSIDARDASDKALAALATDVAGALSLPGGPASIKWVRLYDTVAAMMAHPSSKVPAGATDDLFAAITKQAVRHEADVIAPFVGKRVLPDAQCRDVLRLSIGPLLWHLQHNMAQAASDAAARGLLPGITTLASTATTSKTIASSEGQRIDAEQVQPKHSPSATAVERHQRQHLSRRLGGGQHVIASSGIPSRSLSGGGAAAPRVHFFSGHDSTITPLLAALGIYEVDWPSFTSNLVFELWSAPKPAAASSKEELWVRILLDRKPLDVTHLAHEQGASSSNAAAAGRKASEGWLTMAQLQAHWQPLSLSVLDHRAACS